MPRYYLDLCCLKRPFDDQRQRRIRDEAAAVASIVEAAERGAIELIRSPALEFENQENPREDRRLATALWLDSATVVVKASRNVDRRARALAEQGFAVLDALHVAFAEAAGADGLLTCDDRLIRLGTTRGQSLRVRIASPLDVSPDGAT